MKTVLRRFGAFAFNAASLAAAAVLASAAFPNRYGEGLPLLAFLYLIPVFLVIHRCSWVQCPILGFIYGWTFFAIHNYWLSSYHVLAIDLVAGIKGLQYIILFLFLKAADRLFRRNAHFAMTGVYVSYLYLTQQFFIGYPYGNISAAVSGMTRLIQIADITGIWGICLLLVFPQALASLMITRRRFRTYLPDAALAALLYASVLGYGTWALARYSEVSPDSVLRIAAIQHSHDNWDGGDEAYRRNFETLSRLSFESLEADPDMVIWSEVAFTPALEWNLEYPASNRREELVHDFLDFTRVLGVPFLTGNAEAILKDESLPAYLDDGTQNWIRYNGVIFFKDGEPAGRYRKQHLVPFSEHFPYEEVFPRIYSSLLNLGYNWWEEGDEATLFELDGWRFGTPICFEDSFGSLCAAFVSEGADLLVNQSNDVWSGEVSAEWQHLQLARYRAVENRRPLIRGTNSGITCLVLPDGSIVEPMEPFAVAWHVYEVPLVEDAELTFYTRHPDLVAHLVLASTALSLVMSCWHYVVYKIRHGRSM